MQATRNNSATAKLPDSLLSADAYPHPTGEIRLIETHISWVFLTGLRAYKVKKPVNLAFVDFTELSKRKHCCEEEIRLNSRLAPEIYMKTVAITQDSDRHGGLAVDGNGPVVDYAVCMKQFDDQSVLSHLPPDQLTNEMIDQLAETVAGFHFNAAVATTASEHGAPNVVLAQAQDNFGPLTNAVADGIAEAQSLEALTVELQDWTNSEADRLRNQIEARHAAGRICECHGDLHLGNMFLSGNRVTIFDGIEFSDDLRWIDVASEVAFLVMDLHHRERSDLAFRFLNRWLEYSGDYQALHVMPFYLVYRAMVRAKVAALRANQAEPSERGGHWDECQEYLQLAQAFTHRARPSIAITMGASGSGKTTMTQRLIESNGSIRVRSDVERKRLFGLRPEHRPNPDEMEKLYSANTTVRTYERLEELTTEVVDAGYKAIVDATFLQRDDRDLFAVLADRLGVPFLIMTFNVDPKTLKSRVRKRNATENDASDATESVVERQLAAVEPLCPSAEEPKSVDAKQHVDEVTGQSS